MPEGPETHRTADRLAAAVSGARVLSAWFAFPALREHQRALAGSRVTGVVAQGKALLIHFDHGWTLYSHNQLYGIWQVVEPGVRPTSRRSLRVALDTARHSLLLYSASEIEMWPTTRLAGHPFLSRLGPDVLDPALDVASMERRLAEPRFARRQLAGLLLDQGFLAGMGNYLRSEVLHAAGLAGTRSPATLESGERRRLARALLAEPLRSYRSRGIAAASGMRADHTAEDADEYRFRVFGREGLPCPACGTLIQRTSAAGRRLYACPRCQH
jgi:endonuclease VIII